MLTKQGRFLTFALMLFAEASIAGEQASNTEILLNAARARTQNTEFYDSAYRVIAYPNGDVPDTLGVCSDLIIRAYRAINIDLQVLVHEDMAAHFSAYPTRWHLKKADSNIDHRRVPNLQRYFERQGASLRISNNPADYKPGDLVTWALPGNLPHIGIVSNQHNKDGTRPMILHNIGAGPKEEDALMSYRITGHYRFRLPP